jgi:DNA-directed RNA polymerase
MGKLSAILYFAIYVKIPSLKYFINYLNQIIRVILKINKPLFWITPSHINIFLSYIKKSTVNTKSLYIKQRGITISLPTSTVDPDANLRSFIPNLIHSMDAINIHLLISKIMEGLNKSNNDKNINIYTIHDCFATTPDTMNLINQTVKAVFIDLYFYH